MNGTALQTRGSHLQQLDEQRHGSAQLGHSIAWSYDTDRRILASSHPSKGCSQRIWSARAGRIVLLLR